mgnify:CR=1 FL=1
MIRPKIIDCHTHAYPEEVTSNPQKWANKHGEHHWAELVVPESRKSIQGWSDPAQVLAAIYIYTPPTKKSGAKSGLSWSSWSFSGDFP